MIIHTWKVLHNWASKASLYFNKWISIHSYNGKPFSLALTSLKEGASSRIYTKYRPSSPGGRNSSWNQMKSADGESINAELKLNWAYLSTGDLIELTHQPIHWHISPQSIHESPHMWRRERGRNSPWRQLKINSGSDLITSFSQGFVRSSQSASDLIDFNQIGWESTDLWFWICSVIHQFID